MPIVGEFGHSCPNLCAASRVVKKIVLLLATMSDVGQLLKQRGGWLSEERSEAESEAQRAG